MSSDAGGQAQEALHHLVAAIPDGIVVVDEAGIVRFTNPAADALFGRHTESLHRAPFGHPLQGPGRTEIELVNTRGVHRVVEMNVTELWWDDEPMRAAVLRDVTEQRDAEKQLREAVRTRDDVLSIVSHDLRNPLTVIHAAADDLLQELRQLDDDQVRLLETISRQAVRALEMMNRLLTMARADAGKLPVRVRPVRVKERIGAALESLDVDDVQVACIDGLRCRADPDHLDVMLTNLIQNAAKHGQPPVHVVAEVDDDRVLIRVRDHGNGVPDDLEDRIFDRFSQGSDSRGGAGLGLAIVRRLARLQGGDVWHERQDHGACFCVALPTAEPTQ